LNAKKII